MTFARTGTAAGLLALVAGAVTASVAVGQDAPSRPAAPPTSTPTAAGPGATTPTATTPADGTPGARPGAGDPGSPADTDTEAADPRELLEACTGRYRVITATGGARAIGRPIGLAELSARDDRAILAFRTKAGRWQLRATLTGTGTGTDPGADAGADVALGPIDDGAAVPPALAGGRLRLEADPCTIAVAEADGGFGAPELLFARGTTPEQAEAAALEDLWEDVGVQRAASRLLLDGDDPRPVARARLATDDVMLERLKAGGAAAARRLLAAGDVVWGESATRPRDADGSRLRADGDGRFTGDAWDVTIGDPAQDGLRPARVRVHNGWLADQILGPKARTAPVRIADRDATKRADRAAIDLFGGGRGDDALPDRGLLVDIYAGTGISAAESIDPAGWQRSGPVGDAETSNGAISMAAQRPQTTFRLPLWRAQAFATYFAVKGESAALWDNWLNAVWYQPPSAPDGAPYKIQIAGNAQNALNDRAGTWTLGPGSLPGTTQGTIDILTFKPYGVDNPNASVASLRGVGWPYAPTRSLDPGYDSAVAQVRVEPAGDVGRTSLSISVPYPSEVPGPVIGSPLAGPVAASEQLGYGSNPCQRPPTPESASSQAQGAGIRAYLYADAAPSRLPTFGSDPFAGQTPAKGTANADARPSTFRRQLDDSGVENDDRSVSSKVIRIDGETAIACADVRQATTPTACRDFYDRSMKGPWGDLRLYSVRVSTKAGVCTGELSYVPEAEGRREDRRLLCPPGSDSYVFLCGQTEVTVAKGRLTCPSAYPYNLSYAPKPDQYYHLNLSFLEKGAAKLAKDGLMGAAAAAGNWYSGKPPAKAGLDAAKRTLAANSVRMQLERDRFASADRTADAWQSALARQAGDRARARLLAGDTPLMTIAEEDEDDDGARARAAGAPVARAAGLVEDLAGQAAVGLVGLAFKALNLSDVSWRVRWDPDPYQVATDASAYDDLTDRWGVVYQMEEEQMMNGRTSAHGSKGTGPSDRGYQDVAVAAWGAAGSAYIMCSSTPDGPPAPQ